MILLQLMGSKLARARYCARSMLGWCNVAGAQPNPAHRALAELKRRDRIKVQNQLQVLARSRMRAVA